MAAFLTRQALPLLPVLLSLLSVPPALALPPALRLALALVPSRLTLSRALAFALHVFHLALALPFLTQVRQKRADGFNMKFLHADQRRGKYVYEIQTFSLFAITSGPSQVRFADAVCERVRQSLGTVLAAVVAPPLAAAPSGAPPSGSAPPGAPPPVNAAASRLFEKLESMRAEHKDADFTSPAFDPLLMSSLLQAVNDPSGKTDEEKLQGFLNANFDELTLRRFLVSSGYAAWTLPQSVDAMLSSVVKCLLDESE